MSCQRLSSSATFVSPQPVDWAAHLMPTVIAGRPRPEQALRCPKRVRPCIFMVMDPAPLILKRASASRPSGERSEDDYDVLAEGVVVGRIMRAIVAPVESPLFWTLAYGYHHNRRPSHGYAATREAAMAAFAKSWRSK